MPEDSGYRTNSDNRLMLKASDSIQKTEVLAIIARVLWGSTRSTGENWKGKLQPPLFIRRSIFVQPRGKILGKLDFLGNDQ